MAPLFNFMYEAWHLNRAGKHFSRAGTVLAQFDEINLEMRGALK